LQALRESRISFLIRHDRLTPAAIERAFGEAMTPALAELRDAFERAKPRVRELARQEQD